MHPAVTPSLRPRHQPPAPLPFPMRSSAAAHAIASPCATCRLRDICLPAGVHEEQLSAFDRLTLSRRKVAAGDCLYRQGDPFLFLYAVHSGSFKATLTRRDGIDQTTNLFLGGDILGLDGAANGAHASNAVALEDAEVCAIPYDQLTRLTAGNSATQHVIGRLMAREIVRDQRMMLMLGTMSAEQRVAGFLLNVARRMKARGYSGTEFHLRMTRAEIGSYLALKLETVSRTFRSLQDRRLVEVNQKHVRICDPEGLARLIGLNE